MFLVNRPMTMGRVCGVFMRRLRSCSWQPPERTRTAPQGQIAREPIKDLDPSRDVFAFKVDSTAGCFSGGPQECLRGRVAGQGDNPFIPPDTMDLIAEVALCGLDQVPTSGTEKLAGME